MLDRIIKWSLDNRLITLFGAVLIIATGVWAALTLPVDVFPDLTAPTVTVLAEAHGMAPEEVETLITFPIETALNGATGVRRVRSSSSQGIAIVWAEFDWGTDIFLARQIVSEKLQLVSGQLPSSVDPPILAPISSVMGEILLVGMTSDSHSAIEVRSAADWMVRRRLLAIEGVSQVVPIGGEVKQYQVRVNPTSLQALGISLLDVLEATSSSNENASGGIYRSNGREILIRGIGRAQKIEDIARTVVTTRNGSPIFLEDVAKVVTGPAPRFGTASVNGKSAVILSIQKQPSANTLELTRRIDDELANIQFQLPEGIEINQSIFRQATFITLAVNNVIEALRDGALFVVIILFLFLWNFRTTGISILAIPLSLAAALLAMKLLGITINTMTLGGMAIAIGALVDDAVIDVENVFRRLRENRSLPKANRKPPLGIIYEASREVRGPILNATLIITIVFIPLFFLSGVEGRMLQPLGLAYIISILASLIVAVTVTPALCYYLLPKARVLDNPKESWVVETLKKGYAVLLRMTMARSSMVIGFASILVICTIATFPFLGRGFLPTFQEGTLVISAVTLPGTDLQTSDGLGQRIEGILLSHSFVTSTSRRTGRAELDEHAQGANAAEIDVQLNLRDLTLEEALEELRSALSLVPGTNITIGQPIGHRIDHMLSGTRASVAIKLFGTDLYQLRKEAEKIRISASQVPGVVDLSVEQQADVPQLRIYANRETMAQYGVTPGQLSETIDVAFAGETVSQVREGQEAYDLVVRFENKARQNEAALSKALIDTPLGGKVPLSHLASIREERGPNTISRENVQRKIVISANVAGRDVGSVVEEMRQRIQEDVPLLDGYYVEYGGQFESAQQATRTIVLLSVLSIFLIFLILYQEFSSSRYALLIMINLPLALSGGILSLFLFLSGELNVASLVGFITLFGIAVRNGILLVSHYIHLLEEGKPLHDAVFQGSMERLNPILMTALTAGLALIPLALGSGEPGKEIQTPMALVILGGLLTATFLNMVVVPALFLRFGHRNGRISTDPTQPHST